MSCGRLRNLDEAPPRGSSVLLIIVIFRLNGGQCHDFLLRYLISESQIVFVSDAYSLRISSRAA